MIKTGDRIRIFENTDVNAYVRMIKGLGYDCNRTSDYLYVGQKITEDLKDRIKKMRLAMYFKRKEIAEELGMPYREYIEWEEGRGIPKGKYLKAFCQLANATEDYVLYGKGTWNPDEENLTNAWWKKS